MSHEHDHHQTLRPLPEHFVGSTGLGNPKISIPQQLSASNSLNEILAYARQEKASDIHLTVGEPIILRQFTQLVRTATEALSAERIEQMIKAEIDPAVFEEYLQTGDKEFIHTLEGFGRFRMTLIRQRLGTDMTIRLIPMNLPDFKNSGLPASCAGLTKWSQGLVLVAGPAGCGKTTTLGILIEMINQTRSDHIISIEAPVEIVFAPQKCEFTQREINLHTHSQYNALRAALREDPDIIVISELRDLATIQLAISAAETGHLVFGTMNTLSASQTISRIIDSFPADEQPVIRNMLSESLRGVICQQLLPTKDGKSVIPVFEVLLVNQPVANMIRQDKIAQINNLIATSKSAGMELMDAAIKLYFSLGKISEATARERMRNPQLLQSSI